MLVYNGNMILVVGFAVLCGIGGWSTTHDSSMVGFATGGGATVFDLFLRLKEAGTEGLIEPDAGGHIWFIPAWLWGLAGIGIGVAMSLGAI